MPRKEDPGKKNLLSATGDSGVILLVYKISTASCEALKRALIVQPFRDLVSVLHSLVSAYCLEPSASWSPLFPCVISLVQIDVIGPQVFWHV